MPSARFRAARAGGALFLALSFVLIPGRAVADDAASAEALFIEAKALMKEGRFAEACPKLAASLKLDRTVGTLMNLADCHEKAGKIASAWAGWGAALEILQRSGDDRASFARDRQATLTERLPRLKVEVRAPRAGLDVYRDEEKLDPGAYGAALPVDPGSHVVRVRRGDQVLAEQQVVLAERESKAATLDLEAIDRATPPATPPPKDTSTPAHPLAPAPTTQRTVGLVVGGVGVVAVAVAAGFGIAALSQVGTADKPDSCVNQYCGPQGIDAIDKARTFADVAQWVGIGGLVVTGLGVVLFVTAPSSSSRATEQRSATRPRVTPWIGSSTGGVSITGSM